MLMLWPWSLPVRALGHTSGVDAVIVGTSGLGARTKGWHGLASAALRGAWAE